MLYVFDVCYRGISVAKSMARARVRKQAGYIEAYRDGSSLNEQARGPGRAILFATLSPEAEHDRLSARRGDKVRYFALY